MSWLITGTTRLDPDAQSYIGRVEQADQANLEPAVKDAINAFVVGCKADGIWNAIKASCILAGARTLNGALFPLKGVAPTNVRVGANQYNRKTGITGNNGTSYINSNRLSNDDPRDNNHFSVYITSPPATGSNRLIIGSIGTSSGYQSLNTGGNITYRGANRSIVFNLAPISSTGLMGTSRSNDSSFIFRGNNTNSTVNGNSSPPVADPIWLLGGAGPGSNAVIAFYSIGESLDLDLLDTRVTTLINAFAAAIP